MRVLGIGAQAGASPVTDWMAAGGETVSRHLLNPWQIARALSGTDTGFPLKPIAGRPPNAIAAHG